jgi:hypothetical protein
MSTAANRFGLSAISRSNKASAINEEILLNKATGQMLNKTTTGDIVSYDYNNRLREHLDKVTLLGQTNAIRGTVNMISFDNIETPDVVTDAANLLTSTLTLKASSPKRILVSVDVDDIEVSSTIAGAIGVNEPTISLTLRLTTGSTNTDNVISGPLSQINTKIIDPAKYFPPGTDLTNYSMSITNLTVTKSALYAANAVRHILHSVLIIVE